MKLLIVDDEEHVREGVQLSIDWKQYRFDEIYMAENGLEALELVRRHHPELIICDMSMHIMDGPQFLEKLREEGWSSKVIGLSGYQQFEYARATLLANGVDYLLKPFKISDLEKTVEKACALIREEQETQLKQLSARFRLNEVDQLAKAQRFSGLIEEEGVSAEALSSFMASVGIDPNAFYTATFLPRNKDRVVKQYYGRDERLFTFAVNNIIEEIIGPLGPVYAVPHEAFLLLFLSSNRHPDEVGQAIGRLTEAWHRTLRLSCFTGFRKRALTAGELQQTLLEERSAILGCNVLSPDRGKAGEKAEDLSFFNGKERVILEALLSRNTGYLKQLIAEFKNKLAARGSVTLRELQHYTVETNVLLMRLYDQLGDERLHETMPLWLTQPEEWAAKLEQIFADMLERIDYEKGDITQNASIGVVRHYIHDHMKEDITLAGLAETFHFSPQYLAKRFKEEYGTTIMSYLTERRMEQARLLLAHTELSIQEVALESGFEDHNYFGKVFRKHFGLSPTAYRKTVNSN